MGSGRSFPFRSIEDTFDDRLVGTSLWLYFLRLGRDILYIPEEGYHPEQEGRLQQHLRLL